MMQARARALAAEFPLTKGKYRVEAGFGAAGLASTLPLRLECFRAGQGEDRDGFDADCLHLSLHERESGQIVACFRGMLLQADQIGQSYSAQSYNLAPLAQFGAPVLELGRFALHPKWHDPDILRLAWAAITRLVDAAGVGLLFGCTSFLGAEEARHRAALALLAARHIGPQDWLPKPLAVEQVRFAEGRSDQVLDLRAGLAQMPLLLRSYLTLGGWVSDHAVLDRDLDTLHVFTAVEIASIPPARARALREIARSGD